jgi:hypothetical protein
MAKNVHDDVLDQALNYLKNNGNRLVILTQEAPTTASGYSNAQQDHKSSGYRIAEATISASDFTGPANGDTSGRKVAVNAQSSLSINGIASSTSQSATHVALVKQHASASSQAVLYNTTCTTQSLTQGNKVNTPAWDIEIRDPA